MRPLRFAVFLVLIAGLLSAAGYLWAPLVSPQVEALHLSAPPIASRVIEPPLRIRPVDLLAPSVRELLPLHAAGSLHVIARRLDFTPVMPHVATHALVAAPQQSAVSPPPPAPVVHHQAPAKIPVAAPKLNAPAPAPLETPAPAPAIEAEPAPAPVVSHPAPPAVVVPTPAPPPLPSLPAVAAPPAVVTPVQAPPQAATIAPATAAPTTAPASAPTPAPASTPPPAAGPTPPTPPAIVPPTPPTIVPPTPPTPPPVVDPASRPGWGCGDQNHDHTGPSNASQPSPC